MRIRIIIEFAVQSSDKVDSAVNVRSIPIAQQPISRQFKVVLNNWAMISFRQTIPHLRKVRVLPLQGCFYGFRRTIHILRKFCDVAAGCVNENQVRLKSFQLWIFKHGILPVASIFRLIKRRLNPIVQQEQFQHGNNIICGRTAQNCNLFFHARRAVCQQSLFNLSAVFQNPRTIKWYL